VKEIHADFNTPVKKGQVIARIDPATYELRVNQALADLEAAREQLQALQAQPKASAAQLRAAFAAAKQRESLLRQAQADLERTVIRAPAEGTVILRNVDAGQTVAAGPQAPVLFTIAQDLREMQIEAAIDAADAGRLRAGMPASFAVDAFPRRSFEGEVRRIRRPPDTVIIAARNPDLALLPGMTANVRVVVEERAAALKVPNAALRWRPAEAASPAASPKPRSRGRRGTVHVLEDGRPRAVEVSLGLDDGSSTEVVEAPFAEGTQVIVGLAAASAPASRGPRGAASSSP
jgi:HlyD family secretion protein